MKNKRKTVNEKLKEYHLNILSKLLNERELNNLNKKYLCYFNNKTGIIRIISCPYLYRDGGVVYILKSLKKDIANYSIIKKIEIKDNEFFGIGLDAVIDLRYRNNSKLIVVSNVVDEFFNKLYIKLYLFTRILGKRALVRSISYPVNINLKDVDITNLKNIVILNNDEINLIIDNFDNDKKHRRTLKLQSILNTQSCRLV